MSKKILMKGNEAIGEAAVRAGCRFYFAYPITPQNEIPAYMSKRLPQVGGQVIVGVHAQLPHEFCHFRNVDRSHVVLLYSSAPLMKTACT